MQGDKAMLLAEAHARTTLACAYRSRGVKRPPRDAHITYKHLVVMLTSAPGKMGALKPKY